MFSLNSFAKENKMYCEENGKYLYKGFFLSYTSLLEYKKAIGKIILFSTFISTIENEQNVKGLLKFKSDSKFGVILIIKNIYKKGWVSNVINIQSASLYNEREFVILPFSFFLVKDVQINTKDYTAKINLETIGKTEILENKIKIGNEIEYNKNKKIMEIKK